MSQHDHTVPPLVSFSPAWSSEAAALRLGRFVRDRCESEPASQC